MLCTENINQDPRSIDYEHEAIKALHNHTCVNMEILTAYLGVHNSMFLFDSLKSRLVETFSFVCFIIYALRGNVSWPINIWEYMGKWINKYKWVNNLLH